MSDVELSAIATKRELEDLAKQAKLLGNGLQNVAPGDSPSAQYLLDTAASIEKVTEKVDEILTVFASNKKSKKP